MSFLGVVHFPCPLAGFLNLSARLCVLSSTCTHVDRLSAQTARAAKAAVGTPAYVYDAASLKANAEACLAFPNAYGLTVRYAMKSLPNKAVLQLFHG